MGKARDTERADSDCRAAGAWNGAGGAAAAHLIDDLMPASIAPAVWLWATPEAAAAIASRDLPTILRAYRRINRISQAELADQLGYDKSYVSMVETRRRAISDAVVRRQIAARLGIPPRVLGVMGIDDVEYRAMIQFGESTVRLAEIARQAGRTVEAVNELWPLVARLEARAGERDLERDSLELLAKARTALGVSLGTVLPEERLASATQWTGQAVTVAAHLDNPTLHAHTLRTHGNELRKAGRTVAAVECLDYAIAMSRDPAEQGSGLALICRAYGDLGDARRFDQAFDAYRKLLEQHPNSGLLFQPFTLREVGMRGLLCTGRAKEAWRNAQDLVGSPSAPQWRIIERITTAEVFAAVGEVDGAAEMFRHALVEADHHHLPHQIQRVIRAATKTGISELVGEGQATLRRVQARPSGVQSSSSNGLASGK